MKTYGTILEFHQRGGFDPVSLHVPDVGDIVYHLLAEGLQKTYRSRPPHEIQTMSCIHYVNQVYIDMGSGTGIASRRLRNHAEETLVVDLMAQTVTLWVDVPIKSWTIKKFIRKQGVDL